VTAVAFRHLLFRGLLMKSFLLSVMVLLLAVGVSGCSLSGEKPESQRKLREALEVPPDLARPQGADPASGLPSGTAVYSTYSSKTPESPQQPQGVQAPAPVSKTGVNLERDGSQRWLVVQDAPDRVLARVRSHLVGRKMDLAIDDPKSGIFETEWKERKINLGANTLTRMLSSMQSTGLRDKFRIRIEPGRVAGTSEIYVSHLGLEEVVIGESSGPATTWQPRATDMEAEAQLLSALMTSFGLSEQEAAGQAGQTVAGSALKVKDGLLLQQQDLDRAWRRVGQALDRSGFVIEDRDRHLGIYYVYDRPVADTAKKSSWLTFGENKEVHEDRFQVVLKAVEGGTSMKVLNVKGERTESKNGDRLFEYLQQQLQ
jgi:outer membrane protein assembly factor BamC